MAANLISDAPVLKINYLLTSQSITLGSLVTTLFNAAYTRSCVSPHTTLCGWPICKRSVRGAATVTNGWFYKTEET